MRSELFEPLYGAMTPRNTYALYALMNTGKTVGAMTEVAFQASQGVRTLWMDTEGGLNPDTADDSIWNTWKPRLEKRYGLKDLNAFVEYKQLDDYEELMRFLGYEVDVEYGDNKIAVKMHGKLGKTQLEGTVWDKEDGFGNRRKDTLVVLDSLSSPLRLEFGSNVANFATRADATGYLLHALNKLIKQVNAPLITTNHASLNPAEMYKKVSSVHMRGGSTVGYYSKSVAYLEIPATGALHSFRKMWAVRSARAEPWAAQAWFRIDGERGFVLSNNEEVAQAIAEWEKAKALKKAAGKKSEEEE